MIDDIRGLVQVSPTVGWGLMLGTLAILGMPPFGVFASEFLIITTAMREQPWATPLLLVALGVAFAAVFGKVQPMVFGETDSQAAAPSARNAAGVPASGAGADARALHPALARRLVSAGGAVDRLRREKVNFPARRWARGTAAPEACRRGAGLARHGRRRRPARACARRPASTAGGSRRSGARDERDRGDGFALHVLLVVEHALHWIEVPLPTSVRAIPI